MSISTTSSPRERRARSASKATAAGSPPARRFTISAPARSAQMLELLDRGGAVGVAGRDDHGLCPRARSAAASLPIVVVLPEPFTPDDEDHVRLLRVRDDRARAARQDRLRARLERAADLRRVEASSPRRGTRPAVRTPRSAPNRHALDLVERSKPGRARSCRAARPSSLPMSRRATSPAPRQSGARRRRPQARRRAPREPRPRLRGGSTSRGRVGGGTGSPLGRGRAARAAQAEHEARERARRRATAPPTSSGPQGELRRQVGHGPGSLVHSASLGCASLRAPPALVCADIGPRACRAVSPRSATRRGPP